jgi:hypothetical protein
MTASDLLSAPAAAIGRITAPIARRGLDRWLLPYMFQAPGRWARRVGRPAHVLLCIADHFEPARGGADRRLAEERLAPWILDYPRLFERFRDADGRPPRHTFFYPLEEYEPWALDALAGLCRRGFGEVEVHLHHDGETPDSLRARLLGFKEVLNRGHGLLPRDRVTGRTAYGFIHGNWALDNSRPDGRWCGVNNEIDILVETGCYADFTLPSAPSPTQTPTINRIYYATDDPGRPRSHDRGVRLGVGPAPAGSLLLIQGPLVLDWRRRPVPRVENGCLQANQPPSIDRLEAWLRARVQVPTRPDWYFVKLHSHGAVEANSKVLLGEPMVAFHRALAELSDRDPGLHIHYVTAREMYNLARAAEAGWAGGVDEARDFELVWDGDGGGRR